VLELLYLIKIYHNKDQINFNSRLFTMNKKKMLKKSGKTGKKLSIKKSV
jgi:hypothetical protein